MDNGSSQLAVAGTGCFKPPPNNEYSNRILGKYNYMFGEIIQKLSRIFMNFIGIDFHYILYYNNIVIDYGRKRIIYYAYN